MIFRFGHILPACWLVAVAWACSDPAAAGKIGSVSLSDQTVALGRLVDLRVRVRVPAGAIVYFPRRIPATDAIESHRPAQWTATPAPGGTRLDLSYSLLTLDIGRIAVPGFDIRVARGGVTGRGAALPGGAYIGTTDTAPPSAMPFTRIPPREIKVASLMELEAVLAGVGPMPPADVIGRNWNIVSVALSIVAAAGFLGMIVVAALYRRGRSRDARDGRRTGLPAGGRVAAMRALDELLAEGLHTEGRVREFFAQTGMIVRRYVERFDPRWGPHLTSTELMRELSARPDYAPHDLLTELEAAEFVKFGPGGSGSTAAERHWRAVRRWIERSGREGA